MLLLSVLTCYLSFWIKDAYSWELKSSVHHAIFKLLCDLLFELFQLLLNLRVDVTRLLQTSASETYCVTTRRARSLSKHSVPNLTEVRLPINILSNHGLG